MFNGDEPLEPSPGGSSTDLTPSKRIRANELTPQDAGLFGIGNVSQDMSNPVSSWNEGITAAQLEHLLGARILPLLVEQMNDKFNTLQNQYQNTVTQASKLFEDVQNAMVILQSQQTQLSTTLAAEQQILVDHQHAIRFVKKEQDDALHSIGIQKVNLDHVHDKQVSMQQDMNSFASNVMAGFIKTEEAFKKQPQGCDRSECFRCEEQSNESVMMDERLVRDVNMGQDDRKLRTPVRRDKNGNSGKRNSCPAENENPTNHTSRRSSCPNSDELETIPKKMTILMHSRFLC